MTTPQLHLRIGGGLGNQLFQLGTAFILAERLKAAVRCYDATGQYSQARVMAFHKLLDVSTEAPVFWAALSHRARIGRAMLPFCINDRTIEKTLSSVGHGAQPYRHYFVDGYFQNCWSDITAKTMVDAVGRHVTRLEKSSDIIAVHIRGGDFLKLPQYQVADQDYYSRAINLLLEQLQQERVHLTVVTDDKLYSTSLLAKCKFNGHCTYTFLDGSTSLEDFNTLRSARARVIANSTFSWWASALGHVDALTIACESWMQGCRRTYRLANEILIP